MDYHYVCREPFGKYQRGHIITDADEWAKVKDDHEHRFNRINPPPGVAEVTAGAMAKEEESPFSS